MTQSTIDLPKCVSTENISNGRVTIILGSNHYTRSDSSAHNAYVAAMNYATQPSERTLAKLEGILFPHKRFLEIGGLEEMDDHRVAFKGTNVPVPQPLMDQFLRHIDSDWPIDGLRNFWYRAMMNPNLEARDRFFEFCNEYGITITEKGYAVLYKVVTQKTVVPRNLDLASFVSENYMSVIQKDDDPADYFVYDCGVKGGGYILIKNDGSQEPIGKPIGSLPSVFDRVPELTQSTPTTIYTDKHTKGMEIRLGVPVRMKRSLCDPNINIECSYGLHVGSFKYVSSFSQSGDAIFACLVDPMNVVSLPLRDNSKLRVCEYLPYALMNREDNLKWFEIDSGVFESDYELVDAITLESRFKSLASQLESLQSQDFAKIDPEELGEIQTMYNVVRTRLSTLSHVDTSSAGPISGLYQGMIDDLLEGTGIDSADHDAPVGGSDYKEDEKWTDDDVIKSIGDEVAKEVEEIKKEERDSGVTEEGKIVALPVGEDYDEDPKDFDNEHVRSIVQVWRDSKSKAKFENWLDRSYPFN